MLTANVDYKDVGLEGRNGDYRVPFSTQVIQRGHLGDIRCSSLQNMFGRRTEGFRVEMLASMKQ